VKATVTAVRDYGVVLIAEDKVTTLVAVDEHSTLSKVGKMVSVVVIDADVTKKILEVSIEKSLVSEVSSSLTGSRSFHANMLYEGKVLKIKEKYLVVIVESSIGFVMISDYHCPYFDTDDFEIGQTLKLHLLCEKLEASLEFPHRGVPVWVIFNDSKIIRSEVLRYPYTMCLKYFQCVHKVFENVFLKLVLGFKERLTNQMKNYTSN
jgi:hypothetical protein